MRRAVVLLLVLAVAACAHRLSPAGQAGSPAAGPLDAHVPPYARDPYAPFSRAAAVAIARREWRAFRQLITYPDASLPDEEREEGLWQRVGDYWWIGLDRRFAAAQRWTGMHDENGHVFPAQQDADYAWSAAFVSYVMRVSGAGAKFPYSERHSDYINAAVRHDPGIALTAFRPPDYAPLPGDLVCMYRGKPVSFADLPTPAPFPGHCDIVVATSPGLIDAIGGNVPDEVALKHVPVTQDGRLAGPDGVVLDSNYPWFVVLRVRYDDDAVPPPSAISRARPPSIIASASQGSRASIAR